MKKFFFLFSLTFLLIPFVTQAKMDQRCFTEVECVKARQTYLGMSEESAKDHALYQGSDTKEACGGKTNKQDEQIGFCYPAGQAKTRVSFGGKFDFSGAGEFLQYMYRYAIVVAGILAVIMIIFAGVQWTASGGNAQAIQSAKKRMAGATIGLVIAVLSYSVLFTLNPYLVNIRLPQVWLINQIPLDTEFCRDVPNVNKEKFAYVGAANTKVDISKLSSNDYPISYDPKSVFFNCGKQLIYKSGKDNICKGSSCNISGMDAVCYKLNNVYGCQSGTLVGKITNPGWSIDFIKKDWASAVNQMSLEVVCSDGTHKEIKSDNTNGIDPTERMGLYSILVTNINTSAEASKVCVNSVAKGAVIHADFDKKFSIFDEPHYIGINPSSKQAADLGKNDSAFFEMIKKNGKVFYDKDPLTYLLPMSIFDKENKGGRGLDIDLSNFKVGS